MNTIQHIVNNCKVFVDEEFLLGTESRVFLQQVLLPAFSAAANGCKLVVAQRILQHIEALSNDKQSPLHNNAHLAKKTLGMFTINNRLAVHSEEGEISGEQANTGDLFMRLIYQFQLKFEMAFLLGRQDYARALLAQNSAGSIKQANPLHVLCLAPNHQELTNWQEHITTDAITDKPKKAIRILDLDTMPDNTRIFIDTSSLMCDGAETFIRSTLIPHLQKASSKVFIAQRVIDELSNHVRNGQHHGDDRQQKATSGLELVNELQTLQLADVRQEDNEIVGNQRFFDALVQRLFIQHQKNIPLLLITEDKRLACQILDNAENLCATYFPPKVGYIDKKKPLRLGDWVSRRQWDIYRNENSSADNNGSTRPDSSARQSKPAHDSVRQEHKNASQRIKPFVMSHSVYVGDSRVIPTRQIPVAKDSVTGVTSGRSIRLTEQLSEGGEGVIYKTSITGMICKIYLPNRLTADRKAKLERMVSRKAPAPTICWPEELVHNAQGEFVGYLMPLAKGETFNGTVFKKPLLEATFPHWKREHLVRLAITTLELIKKLHAMNVLIGDINPNNFMVQDENTVYLVDTDSFQIEEFPCPVGTPQFTTPKLIGLEYNTFLRTKENEMFAVATLVFMILFAGKAPFSGQGQGDIIESIKNHRFPYVTEEGEKSARPLGPYKHIWGHLHHFLRQDFREIFYEGIYTPSKQQAFRDADNYVDRFLKDLNIYFGKIRKGEACNDIFPQDQYIPPDQQVESVPCCEPGCTTITSMSKSRYDQLRVTNRHGITCDLHYQLRKLKNSTHQFNRQQYQQGRNTITNKSSRRGYVQRAQPNRQAYAGGRKSSGWSFARIAGVAIVAVVALYGILALFGNNQEPNTSNSNIDSTQPAAAPVAQPALVPAPDSRHHHNKVRHHKMAQHHKPVANPAADMPTDSTPAEPDNNATTSSDVPAVNQNADSADKLAR